MQADGGLSGAGRALDAEGLTEAGSYDAVLFRLDGGDDVAHRAGPGSLDLGLHDVGVRRLAGFGQLFVFVRSQLAVREAGRRRQPTPIGCPGRAW